MPVMDTTIAATWSLVNPIPEHGSHNNTHHGGVQEIQHDGCPHRKIQVAGIQQQRCEHHPAGSHDKRLDKLYPGRL